MDLGIVSTPLQGVGAWLTCMSSYMIFLIIDWDVLTHAGYGYERIRDALEDEDVMPQLEKAPCFGVPPCQSIFVPFANVVVAAALPFSDYENSSDHYGSFVSHFVFPALLNWWPPQQRASRPSMLRPHDASTSRST